jgi:uncharacterized damage-inducible protein DinB
MTRSYSQLVGYKQWADRGLYAVVGQNLDKLDAQDATILLRLLDHMHVVDAIFQHHLQGVPHGFKAPQSVDIPDFPALSNTMRTVDEWYVSYVGNLLDRNFDETVDFVFTNGRPARMTRGEIVLHICLHGTYHRGNAGLVLYKNGITPKDDRMSDFLEMAA